MKGNGNLTSSPLREWADYLTWVSKTGDFQVVAGEHQCIVPLPDGQHLRVQASTPDLLAKKVMAELTSNFVAAPHVADLEKSSCFVPAQDESPKEVPMPRQYEPAVPRASVAPRSVSASSTKDVLQSIGVYVPESMHVALKDIAARQGKKFSVLVREMVEDSYEKFESAIEVQNPRKLLDSYERKVASYSGKSSQWMARVDRPFSLELKLTAKEYGRSASQIVGGLLAEALSHWPETLEAPAVSQEEILQAQAAMRAIAGPKVTALADFMGLSGKRLLVNELLAGVVRAPSVLLGKMADFLNLSRDVVAQAVRCNFQQLPTPSFSAPNGQPRVLTEPVSWSEAVKALNLPADEEAMLLALED